MKKPQNSHNTFSLLSKIGLYLLIAFLSQHAIARKLITKEMAANQEKVSPKEQEDLENIRRNKSTVRVQLVSLDPLAMDDDEIMAPGPKRSTIKIKRISSGYDKDGYFYWSGTTEEMGGQANFYWSEGEGMTGAIRMPKGTIRIRPFNKRFHLLIEIDPQLLPPDHGTEHPNGAQIDKHQTSEINSDALEGDAGVDGISTKTNEAEAATTNTTPEISLLVVLTPNAKRDLINPSREASEAIESLNSSFGTTINLRASLAGMYDISSDYSNDTDALNSLTLMTDVKKKRDELKADAVILIAKFNRPLASCGLAREVKATPFTAFAVADVECFNGNYTFSHELGHLIGARHNYETDPENVPYAFGHGAWAQIAANSTYYCRRDIMTYPISTFRTAVACADDIRINAWSSPLLLGDAINGTRVSFTLGDTAIRNNTLVLNTNGENFSKFSETPISGGLNNFIGILSNIILMITSE